MERIELIFYLAADRNDFSRRVVKPETQIEPNRKINPGFTLFAESCSSATLSIVCWWKSASAFGPGHPSLNIQPVVGTVNPGAARAG